MSELSEHIKDAIAHIDAAEQRIQTIVELLEEHYNSGDVRSIVSHITLQLGFARTELELIDA